LSYHQLKEKSELQKMSHVIDSAHNEYTGVSYRRL